MLLLLIGVGAKRCDDNHYCTSVTQLQFVQSSRLVQQRCFFYRSLTTVQGADEIIVIAGGSPGITLMHCPFESLAPFSVNSGVVAERGTHADLVFKGSVVSSMNCLKQSTGGAKVAKRGAYFNLMQHQLLVLGT